MKNQIHFRAGEYRQVFPWDARSSLITEPACLLLLLWPKEKYGWLKIHLRANHSDSHRSQLSPIDLNGSSEKNDLELLVNRHKRRVGFDDVLKTHKFVCLQWYAGVPLEIEFVIDSNHPDLKELAATRLDPTKPLMAQIEVRAFSPTISSGELGSIGLSLRPCTPLPPFEGFVAVDLGNSSSALVAFKYGSVLMKDILELNSEEGVLPTNRLLEQNNPVESVLRIDNIVTPPSDRSNTPSRVNLTTHTRVFGEESFRQFDETNPLACSFVIGKTARDGVRNGSTKLIFGSKRLLQKKKEKHFSTQLIHKDWRINQQVDTPVQFENYHPAELILSKIFRNFSGSILPSANVAGYPQHIAVTYPTTYDRLEIDQLRKTVTRAWLRFMGFPQTGDLVQNSSHNNSSGIVSKTIVEIQKTIHSKKITTDDDEQSHPLIPLMIDEATAAAFYFLYGRIFEFPGGLKSFSYIYPNGVTLLLYDCGGGTTDIALVSAKLDSEREDDRLLLKVLGRTGDGNFGGDTITEAVCRLLKAKISEVILKHNDSKVPPLNIQKTDDILEVNKTVNAFITEIEKLTIYTELVPTKFDPEDASNVAAKTNMVELWQWAEEIKKALNGPKGDTSKLITYDPVSKDISSIQVGFKISFDPSKGGLAKLIVSKFDNHEQDKSEIVAKLEKIEIKRTEVDALIYPALQKTITRANSLLRNKIEKPSEFEKISHLDFLVVSGNGGRYPLINEMLTKNLTGIDIEDKKAFIPTEDLKDAVAKGAVLFLKCMKDTGRARVDFDTKLSETIPFDIGWKNNQKNIVEILFKEGTRYSEIKEKEISVFNQTSNTSTNNNQFTILKRYPGEEEEDLQDQMKGFKTYYTFTFKDQIQGNIFISFDHEKNIFVVRDVSNQNPKETISNEPDDSYISPIERGKI